jgi:hypothetical protein
MYRTVHQYRICLLYLFTVLFFIPVFWFLVFVAPTLANVYYYHPIIMRFGNRNSIALATALVLLISLLFSKKGETERKTTKDLLAGGQTQTVQTARGPEKLGDHYPIRISSIDDASQIKPAVEGNTRWIYHLCHPGASFINVHFAEFGKLSFC